jgi:lipid A 3-O-deacylase
MRTLRQQVRTSLVAATLAMPLAANAFDSMSFEIGRSDSSNADVDMARVGAQWKWGPRWAVGSSWHIGGYWDVSVGYWNNRTDPTLRTGGSVADIGFTPTFRLQSNDPSGVGPYVEAAIGFHLLSRTSVSTQRAFGSSFQFGDHFGAGVRFGQRGVYDLSYRYQHLSNGGIKAPNQGINFHLIRLQYHF